MHAASRHARVLIGLAFGAGAVHLAVVGVLLMLHQRWIVVDTLSLGQAMLVVLGVGAGAMASPRARGLVATGWHRPALPARRCRVPIAALRGDGRVVPLQSIFIALSPDLLDMLTLGLGLRLGMRLLLGGGASPGCWAPRCGSARAFRARADLPGAVAVLIAGVFQELIQLMLQQYQGRSAPIPRLRSTPGRG